MVTHLLDVSRDREDGLMQDHYFASARAARITTGTSLHPALATALAVLVLFWASVALQLLSLTSWI